MIAGQTGIEFLRRHMSNDWGELSDEDVRENELSLREGFRLLSAYRTARGQKLWIITEADRSSTAILLPPSSTDAVFKRARRECAKHSRRFFLSGLLLRISRL